MSKAKAEELGLDWLAEIGAHGQVAGPDSTLQLQPANATAKAVREGGHRARRPRPGRVQRGVRRRRHRVGPRARHRRRQGQRQRRRDRARPPGRHVRRPDRAAPRARAQAPRRRRRRGRAVRWRRPGRRPDRPRPGLSGLDRLDRRAPRVGAARRRRSPTWSRGPATGDARAVARLISLVEDESPLLREVMAALAPHTGHAQIVGITGSPGRRQVDLDQRAGDRAAPSRQAGRRAGRRPVLAVLRRRAARRPGADAGPRPRPRRLHPLDGLARPPRRAGLDHAAGAAGARRGRLRRDPDRDRRRRAERGRDRRPRRHHAGAARARHGRRDPGRQGRHPRDRRPLRRQQGRPRRRRPGPPRPALDAGARRAARGRLAAADREDRRPDGRGARRGRRRDRPAPRLAGVVRRARRAGVPAGPATRSRRSRSPRCASAGATCTAAPSSTTSPPPWWPGKSDPYAAADELLDAFTEA